MVEPDFYHWASHIRRKILEHVQHEIGYRVKPSGLLKLATFALRRFEFIIVRNDKDNGITLIQPARYDEYLLLALPEPRYKEIYASSANLTTAARDLKSIATAIGKHEEDPRWTHAIMSYAHLPMTCHLGTKLKTHKGDGHILPRAIHQAPKSAWTGLSSWVNRLLVPLLEKLPHIAKDSFHMKSLLESTFCVPARTRRLACLDMKDFYLSGEDHIIATTISEAVPYDSRTKALLHRAIYLLLSCQFVTIQTRSTYFQCCQGSGIGLSHSSAITNYAFYVVCEQKFLDKLSLYGIAGYYRYHDDVILISHTMAQLKHFFSIFKTSLGFFIVEVRAVSRTKVSILDLSVCFHNGYVRCAPLLDKIPLPLCPSSHHAPHTHRAWPKAVSQRIKALACNPADDISRLIRNYKAVPCHPLVVSRLATQQLPKPRESTEECVPLFPCILKYHPCLFRAAKRAVQQVSVPRSLNFKIVQCWSNALPSIHGLCNKRNRQLIDNYN